MSSVTSVERKLPRTLGCADTLQRVQSSPQGLQSPASSPRSAAQADGRRALPRGDSEEHRRVTARQWLKESGLDKLIRASYELLDLITFFTAGKKEVRAWTIKQGWKAPQAAGTIHSDFEKGYIKGEVIKLDDYIKYQTELACKEAGKIAIEGKGYQVEDGDIMHFRFNV